MKKFLVVLMVFACIIGGFWGFKPEVLNAANSEKVYDVPIIMYHSTQKKASGRHAISPAMLEGDLKYFEKNGYTTIFMRDLIDFQEKGTPLPDKPIILTFDDGYANNYRHAFPLFVKYNMKAVFSVVGRLIDENYDSEGKQRSTGAHANYEQIKEMTDSGLIEIQNHTYDMHALKGGRRSMKKQRGESDETYEQKIAADLMKLEGRLKDKVGISCTTVTLPFGAYNETITFDVIKKLGFKAALTCNYGINKVSATSDLLRLKRYNRPSGPEAKQYFAKYGV